MTSPTVPCPNCGQPVASTPIECSVCGYRSDQAREYLWLYLCGGLLTLAGIAIGICGVVAESSGVFRSLAGWFPLGPWPASWHWLACIVAGIVLSLIGMGFTRRFHSSGPALIVLVVWESSWTIARIVRAGTDLATISVLIWEGILLGLAVRLCVALRRVPLRDVEALQRGARAAAESSSGPDSRPQSR